jgi:hypothetical protein
MSEEGFKKASELLDSAEKKAKRQRIDLTEVVGGKKGRKYSFMPNNRQDILQAKLDGYSVVLASENPDLIPGAAEKTADGHFELGDTILMEIPDQLYERYVRDAAEAQDRAILRVKDQFHEEGRRTGVKTFEEGPGEIEDAKERASYESGSRRTFAMKAGVNPETKEVERQPRVGVRIDKTS